MGGRVGVGGWEAGADEDGGQGEYVSVDIEVKVLDYEASDVHHSFIPYSMK